jgi:iron complex transport system ATP-binding protein
MHLFGRERWNVWELRGRLGIVSHDLQTEYPPHATALEVVLSGFRATRGVWPHQRFTDEHWAAAAAVLDRLGVGELEGRAYARMSTGEQRRLLLGRALVHDPDVLVLDEPTSGLDPKACFQYLDIVRGLIRAEKTVVLVTHHIHEIPPEIGRVVLLKEGRVFADGPKTDMLTSGVLSEAFGSPIRVEHGNGFYQVFPAVPGEPVGFSPARR